MTIRWYNYNVSNTNFTSNFTSALSYWKVFYGVSVTKVTSDSFLVSLIEFVTPTTTWWNSKFNSTVVGVTYPYDTNGKEINSAATAQSSTKKIRSALIYFNPDTNAFGYWGMTSLAYRNVIAHEVGHALGFGHYNGGASIMNSDISDFESYTGLQLYDRNEFSRKYYSNP